VSQRHFEYLPTTFSGKVILVTGGRSGIGQAVVGHLLLHGATVASLDLSPVLQGGQERLAEEVCDVSDAASVQAVVDRVATRFGGIDGLVQSAGVTADAVLWKMREADWRRVLDVNLTGAFLMLRAVTPHLRARQGGSVVNVASINGLRGKFGQANYAASKAGVIALTKTAARELGAFKIRVNAVAPGLVRTPLTASLPEDVIQRAVDEAAIKRVSEADDVAAAVLFLLSELSRQITGETLRVDAGQYM